MTATTHPNCIRSILSRKEIPTNAKMFMVAIACSHDYRHMCSEPTIEDLAEMSGMNIRTAHRVVKKAKSMGWITQDKAGMFKKSIFRNKTCDWGEI